MANQFNCQIQFKYKNKYGIEFIIKIKLTPTLD